MCGCMFIFLHMATVQWTDCIFCQISESGLIEILEKVSQQTEKKMTVKVSSIEMSHMFDSFSVSCPSDIVYPLPVQQTEGDGFRWWGRLLSLNGSPGMSQEIWRGYALLGLLIVSLTSIFLLAESWVATLASVCLWKLHTKREKQRREDDVVA